MKEFIELRKRAREKRDKAVKAARDEYADTLVKIASLERDLDGEKTASPKAISACVESVIPSDRTFTTLDLIASLEALDGSRIWRNKSINRHLLRLRRKGILRRIRRAAGSQRAVYVRADVEIERTPFEDMTLSEVIEAVLQDGPLNQTEIVVTMLERGYDTIMADRALRDAVGAELKRNSSRFSRNSHRWRLRGSVHA